MKKITKQILSVLMFLVMAFTLCACQSQSLSPAGQGNHYYYPSDETEVAESETEEIGQDNLYMIVLNNTAEEYLHLYSYATKMEYQYYYGLGTHFYNKYGNYESAIAFTPGKAVWIGNVGEDGRLTEIGISNQVWEYQNITRFSTSPEEGILAIAGSNYRYNEESFTFSDNTRIGLDALTNDDELCVIGIDKTILSVCVTTGHGTLELTNTELFEGSYLQLDRNIFTMITENMTMDLPEGNYQLSVANNGWGGTTEITINRGETTTIDLDTIKGDGPSYGQILFAINVENAVLYLDGEQVDYSAPISIQYGRHSLKVVTDDYEDWSRTLYVNSPEGTIVISISDEDTSTASGNEDSTESSENTSNSEASSESDSGTGDDSTSNLDADYLSDYLSTLSSLIDSLL